jgi:hypothetical protein
LLWRAIVLTEPTLLREGLRLFSDPPARWARLLVAILGWRPLRFLAERWLLRLFRARAARARRLLKGEAERYLAHEAEPLLRATAARIAARPACQ